MGKWLGMAMKSMENWKITTFNGFSRNHQLNIDDCPLPS